MRTLAIALLALASPLASAATQQYPEKPIRWIVPWPPGGGVDIATRTMSPALSEALGQNLIVENRPGASGMVGTSFAAKAPPDGYTIITGAAGPNAILPHLNPKVPYDGLRDFASVVHIANTVYVMVVHPTLRVKNVQELIALAKSRPGELTIGSAGTGTPAHLAGEFFTSLGGVKLVHVSYKGAAAPALDVMSGHSVRTIETISPLLPHIRAGKLKALGVSSSKRSSQLPGVPTIAESGLPNYEIVNWYGLLAPAGTPNAVVERLNSSVNQILARPDVRQRLIASGLEILGSTSEEFRTFRQADFDKWGRIVKSANIKFEP
ncbi:MAG: Bug family tripartite tricarboxylate transporter substrate binding protein [Burkholderiales bacterium]